MKLKGALSLARLRELFNYNPQSGLLTRRTSVTHAPVGSSPTCIDNRGYGRVKIDGKPYRTHQLAWFYYYEVPPARGIDHRNGNKLDNSISNLRLASQSANNKNTKRRKDNTSGCTGVTKYNKSTKWRVRINVNQKEILIGIFDSLDAAIEARAKANVEYGFSERHGMAD